MCAGQPSLIGHFILEKNIYIKLLGVRISIQVVSIRFLFFFLNSKTDEGGGQNRIR